MRASDEPEPDPAALPEAAGDGVRIRLDLSYDGAEFSGWARQPSRRTVQGVLSEALAAVLRVNPLPRLTVAGRTDAGVHARGQVAHFDIPEVAWAEHGPSLLRRLSGILPDDVRVWRAAPAPEGFDARFAAVGRRYAYRVSDHPYGADPIRRSDVLWYPRPLDVDLMNAAAAVLIGEHDFAAFCRKREGATTIRHLMKLDWTRSDEYLIVADVRADAFCHSMVRALVGAMIAVGEGRVPVEFPGEALVSRERHPKLAVVAAHGLTLEEVYYPADEDLAARALQARQMRTLE